MNNINHKSELVLLSPHVPALKGHGASMRVGAHLETLSKHFRVHLFVFAFTDKPVSPTDLSFIHNHTTSFSLLRTEAPRPPKTLLRILGRALSPIPTLLQEYPDSLAEEIKRAIPDNLRVEHIHVFRLSLSRIGELLAKKLRLKTDNLVLDMDDFESESARRKLLLDRPHLGRLMSFSESVDILKTRRLERKMSKVYGVSFLCSDVDKQKFLHRNPKAKIAVVPNVFRAPETPLPSQTARQKNVLFVGSLNYLPNTDAIQYFATDIWQPFLKERGYTVIIAGRQPGDAVRKTCAKNGFTLLEDPPDLTEVYQHAALVIVPLRTGGGTRIKILEALAYNRPVVSTSVGAEGINVQSGVHLILADDPESFAKACSLILEDDQLSASLCQAGLDLVKNNYSMPALERTITAAYKNL